MNTTQARSGRSALTDRQATVLAEIEAYLADHGRPPTHRELSATLGVTTGAVRDFIQALARKGWVALEPGSRGIRILKEAA